MRSCRAGVGLAGAEAGFHAPRPASNMPVALHRGRVDRARRSRLICRSSAARLEVLELHRLDGDVAAVRLPLDVEATRPDDRADSRCSRRSRGRPDEAALGAVARRTLAGRRGKPSHGTLAHRCPVRPGRNEAPAASVRRWTSMPATVDDRRRYRRETPPTADQLRMPCQRRPDPPRGGALGSLDPHGSRRSATTVLLSPTCHSNRSSSFVAEAFRIARQADRGERPASAGRTR